MYNVNANNAVYTTYYIMLIMCTPVSQKSNSDNFKTKTKIDQNLLF